jgi:hypothetical protein
LKRWLIGGVISVALIAAVACAVNRVSEDAQPGRGAVAEPIHVKAAPVPLNRANPAQDHIGDFFYAGGLNLTSRDTDRLHGLSDLVVHSDGRLISEGDEGELFTARLVLDAKGRLTGLTQTTLRRLTGLDGKPLTGKSESDAEGVAQWPNGDLMVSFERRHRIWRYPAAGGPPIALPIPTDPTMIDNNGMEGLAVAPSQGPDAYWVGVEWGQIHLCHIGHGCRPVAASAFRPSSFRLSALTETPDGKLLLLYQSFAAFSGAHLKIMLVDAPASNHPTVLDGFSMDPPYTVDNFEGIAAVPGPNGALRIYVIVDDNFQPSERTLLLAFDRVPPKLPKPAA